MTLIIRKCIIAEIESAPNIAQVLEEYAAESAIKGLPHPLAKVDTYKYLESIDAIHILGAYLADEFIGYIITLAPVLPHYSARVAVVESYFVLKQHRGTGAGMKLLRMSEDWAKREGALGILVSAPLGGALARVLEKSEEYDETNRVFFRKLGDE